MIVIPPIVIDTSTLVDEFSLDQEDINKLLDFTVKEITARFAEKWQDTAIQELKSSRQEYINSLIVVDEGIAKGAVVLVGKLPNMIEQGASQFDMKCLVNRLTPIYTDRGWVGIGKIKVGDLVLTHQGKFKRVVEVFREKVEEQETLYKIESTIKQNKTIITTGNHPVLTERGWIKVENLLDSDKLIVTAIKCPTCGKFIASRIDSKNKFYCSKSCAIKTNQPNKKGIKRTNLSEEALNNISKSKSETNKRLAKEGRHPSQTGGTIWETVKRLHESGEGWGFQRKNIYSKEKLEEIQKKAAIGLGKKARFTDPESIIWPILEKMGFERQVLFKRDYLKPGRYGKGTRNRLYFFDFAHKEHKICIEINGERYHTEEQDNKRRIEVESKGWRYLSFWSKEIYKNLDGCVKRVERVLDNHENNYLFTSTSFKIKKIKRKKLGTVYHYKYNLTVEEDSSFIANGIVVHNSGFLNGPNAKTGENGKKYNTVPFSVGTPGALEENFSTIMPMEVYSIAKKKEVNSPVTSEDLKDLPKLIREPQKKKIQIPESKSFKEYQHKGSIYEGIEKKKDSVTGQTSYQSFRRVSENSDPSAFIHPGIDAHNLAEKTLATFDVPEVTGNAIDLFLEQL